MNEWGFYYASQARRISHIAENAGLKPLVKEIDFRKVMPGQLPFLSSKKYNLQELENNIIQLRKYYIPHDDSKNANYIYNHVINIPTHKEIMNISDDELYNLFKKLA